MNKTMTYASRRQLKRAAGPVRELLEKLTGSYEVEKQQHPEKDLMAL